MRFEPRGMAVEDALGLEWLLTNGIGGYASSTVVGLNSRKYHGLLIASLGSLRRFVCLQELRDLVEADGLKTELHCAEFDGGLLQLPGLESLVEFRRRLGDVVFVYDTAGFTLRKTIAMPQGRNGIVVSYAVLNKTRSSLRHVILPVVNCRSVHEVRRGVFPCVLHASDGKAVVSLGGNELSFSFPDGTLSQQDLWSRGMYYRREAERGYDAVEDSFMPFMLSFDVPAKSRREYRVSAGLGCETNLWQSSGGGNQRSGDKTIDMLRAAAGSFIVSVGGGRTVIAGYHWFGEWGRDAMVSLPGLTLVNSRFDDAEAVLERFLGNVRGGRVMTESESGSPVYRDYDSTLWMVDRLLQYVKYVGPDRGRRLLEENWGTLTDVMEYYAGLVRDGLVGHKNGTWMDTLGRNDAVEVQALWYNALKAYGKLAVVFGFRTGMPVEELSRSFEEKFMEAYWNGRYLKDCRGDDSLRPNQLIALSLDYSCVGRKEALVALESVEESLLTPSGLRTLRPGDKRYRGSYAGDAAAREKSYHNGTVWPWLLGPYVRACVRHRGLPERKRLKLFLEGFFIRALSASAIGSIGELFDGDLPNKPGGCVSQAWSVGEPLRAYVEDSLGIAPKYGSLFT